ncbi:MAG: glycosyltransferase [Rhizobiaceae bacterium]|nr:glycosyltransferase [Rhizobiaceae bacterium]
MVIPFPATNAISLRSPQLVQKSPPVSGIAQYPSVSSEPHTPASGGDAYPAINPEEASAIELAARLDVPYLGALDARQLIIREEECLQMLARRDPQVWATLDGPVSPPHAVVVPNSSAASALDAVNIRGHELKSRVRVASTRTVRQALHDRCTTALERFATKGLFDFAPEFSASIRMNAAQGIGLGAIAVIFVQMLFLQFGATVFAIHVAATVFFIGCTTLRVAASFQRPPTRSLLGDARRAEPVYSVLVALWREAHMVPQLMGALSQLAWPVDRLEIKLICEADDPDTIAAIRAHPLSLMVEVIAVPPSLPRTKPKALRYALPMCRGEFVVLYDAEDIPHPHQLQEAWRVFDNAPAELACLQAPLEIVNGEASWIARCFAFEYAALFRGLVPWLASLKIAFPLGGTSNHFRRAALDAVGAWDPHNVTEDADLGIRLARHGYSAGVLTRPTFEAAPDALADWRPQRARWNKGWLQTWLVHMRSPVRLLRELGFGSFIVTQLVLFGMVFSALVHPAMIVALLYLAFAIVAGVSFGRFDLALVAMDIASIFGGYAGFLVLGWTRLRPKERMSFWKVVAATPAYWMLISVSAWKAVKDLVLNPFYWDKTNHRPFN